MKKSILTLLLLISCLTYANNKGFYGKYTAQFIPSKKDYEKHQVNTEIKSVYYNLTLKKNKNKGISLLLEKKINARKEYIQLYIYDDLTVKKSRNRYKLCKGNTGEVIATIKGNKIIYHPHGYIDLTLTKI